MRHGRVNQGVHHLLLFQKAIITTFSVRDPVWFVGITSVVDRDQVAFDELCPVTTMQEVIAGCSIAREIKSVHFRHEEVDMPDQ
jgi:hypothetical protein